VDDLFVDMVGGDVVGADAVGADVVGEDTMSMTHLFHSGARKWL